ncbi:MULTISPECIES: hypothetical protein [Streptomyces]|uniref:MYXO-CTERM domain-containing protein n=1 Tax=Streptomyces sudanensis TaxID=436397 RepID=A0ABY4T8R8_9ACTN|nr:MULTISPECIES: hypothetical protein [Streptomyces]URN15357.1 hypothetical protein MW084_04695 [Streptomyces sudanensis]
MLRHEFHPGRLVAGVTGLGVAAVYGGDAAGSWQVPWYAGLPLLACGLVLAAVASRIGYRVRRRRAERTTEPEGTSAPSGTNGGHAAG